MNAPDDGPVNRAPRWIFRFLACVLLFVSLGCGQKGASVQIGVTVLETTAPFYTLLRQGMLDVAHQEGVALRWESIAQPPPTWWQRQWYRIQGWPPALSPIQRERALVMQMLREGFKAIVVQPVATDQLDDLIRRAQLARVPLITLDRLPYNRRLAGHTQIHALRVGEMAARFVVRKLEGRGNVILLAGPPNDRKLRQIVVGMYRVLDEYPETIRVFERSVTKLEADEAFGIVNELLSQYAGNIQAVLACDTRLSEGVIRAVQAHGLESRVVTVGIGAGREACRALLPTYERGAVPPHDMEVDLMPYEWGRRLMQALLELVRDERIRQLPHDEMMRNGDVEVPVLYAPAREITPENVRLMRRMWPDLFEEK